MHNEFAVGRKRRVGIAATAGDSGYVAAIGAHFRQLHIVICLLADDAVLGWCLRTILGTGCEASRVEEDPGSVGRPCGMNVLSHSVRQLMNVAAVGIHQEDV